MDRMTRGPLRIGLPRKISFLTDYEDQDLVIPEDLTTLSAEDLAALSERANAAFSDLFGDGTGLTQDDLTALAGLTEGIEALAAEDARRSTEQADRDAQAAELAARIQPNAADTDQSTEDEGGEGEDGEGDEDEDEGEGGDEQPVEGDEQSTEEDSVTAGSGRREIRVRTSGLARRTPRSPAGNQPTVPTIRDFAFASTETGGQNVGAPLDFTDMGNILDRRLSTFNNKTYEKAHREGRKLYAQHGIATIQKPHGADLTILETSSQAHIEEVLKRATDMSGRTAESLVASGGWCAPSEIIYDVYDCGETADGLLSMPTIGMPRGGVRFNRGIGFNELLSQVGFFYTEQQDIDGDYDGEGGGSKPCFKIPCIDFEEVRLDLDGLCITAGLLQSRGYPEVIADTLRKALIAHEIRMDSRTIATIASGSTAVALPADQVGAAAPILTAIELQAQHYRSAGALSDNTVLEGVFPQWVRGAIRSDLSRRLGVDLISVPNARINQWFTDRQIVPQFVANWQNIGTTPASGFMQWPGEVDFLLYKAGTWVSGKSDVVTLDNVYDSTMLGTNDYTALFTEEGIATFRRGCDSRVVTVPICPDGNTGGGVLIDCDGSAGTPA